MDTKKEEYKKAIPKLPAFMKKIYIENAKWIKAIYWKGADQHLTLGNEKKSNNKKLNGLVDRYAAC